MMLAVRAERRRDRKDEDVGHCQDGESMAGGVAARMAQELVGSDGLKDESARVPGVA